MQEQTIRTLSICSAFSTRINSASANNLNAVKLFGLELAYNRGGKHTECVQIVRPEAFTYKREGNQFERVQSVRILRLA